MRQIQWQDRFSVGVDAIDQAHHRLFAIVEKITQLYVERHESKFACVEGIKYFKAYALKHFAEEEDYMRAAGYPGYRAHKRLHDRMRWETLPALERELYATDFSTEAVQHFIGTCVGWLTGHIMIEDRAITGRTAGEFAPPRLDDELSVIQAVIVQPLQEILGLDVRFVGRFSTKDVIRDARYYEMIYHSRTGRRVRFVLVIGEKAMVRAAGLMFGIEFYDMNEIARFAIRELAQNLIQRASACFGQDSGAYEMEEERFLEAWEYNQEFSERAPQYSLLFNVMEDCFALCIDRLTGDGAPAPLGGAEDGPG
ncbi:MAG: hypothetical protein HFF28_03665 [Oscillospiraceae bacterium]|nr:hypothetical protein [Oscillospiraceae bacterium]MCI9309258.1 hypothetical protein [Oscillospiraceae bacterium]